MKLDWPYQEGYSNVSMPGYVNKFLKRVQHETIHQPQYAQHKNEPIVYVKQGCQHYATAKDKTQQITTKEKNFIQQVAGSFLYYGRSVNYTILLSLIKIAHR